MFTQQSTVKRCLSKWCLCNRKWIRWWYGTR